MYEHFLKRATQLHANDEAFAVATVVRCEAPTSGKPGDRAIVTADGKISGWIGGGCAQPIVIDQSLKSLKDGKSRLIRVSPTAGAEPADGITGFTMMCHSGGTLDIFIEPVLAKPHFLIYGRSPVAQALAKLAEALAYGVTLVDDQITSSKIRVTPQTALVIATQGEDDEGALEQALQLQAPYIAFVASKTKWEAVAAFLKTKGISEEKITSIRVPAGLDIGAQTPEEIAVSILAESIQARRKSDQPQMHEIPMIETRKEKDPVCGMMVNVPAKYTSEYKGNKIYFCCAHCKSSFDKNPESFIQL